MDFILEIVASVRATKSMYDLKRANKPDVVIKIVRNNQLDVDQTLIENYCQIISNLSPCGKVDLYSDNCFDAPESKTGKVDLSRWSTTELAQLNATVYVDVSRHLNWEKEIQKLFDKRAKLLKELDKAKKLAARREEALPLSVVEHFDSQLAVLKDKEVFLYQISK